MKEDSAGRFGPRSTRDHRVFHDLLCLVRFTGYTNREALARTARIIDAFFFVVNKNFPSGRSEGLSIGSARLGGHSARLLAVKGDFPFSLSMLGIASSPWRDCEPREGSFRLTRLTLDANLAGVLGRRGRTAYNSHQREEGHAAACGIRRCWADPRDRDRRVLGDFSRGVGAGTALFRLPSPDPSRARVRAATEHGGARAHVLSALWSPFPGARSGACRCGLGDGFCVRAED